MVHYGSLLFTMVHYGSLRFTMVLYGSGRHSGRLHYAHSLGFNTLIIKISSFICTKLDGLDHMEIVSELKNLRPPITV